MRNELDPRDRPGSLDGDTHRGFSTELVLGYEYPSRTVLGRYSMPEIPGDAVSVCRQSKTTTVLNVIFDLVSLPI